VLLQALADDPGLTSDTRNAITDPANEVFVSAVSIWEIALKRSLGKLQAPDGIAFLIEESGFSELVVTSFHAEQAGGLPMHHRDPFDRMLVAQAQAEGLSIVTTDSRIPLYRVRTIIA
jgi:PIN domain nuclease of toxin-antitoxin system